jgi:hypothetical protein
MSQFRLAALLAVVSAAGCYRDAQEPSTLPEPAYFSGPPGGTFDHGTVGSPGVPGSSSYRPYEDQAYGDPAREQAYGPDGEQGDEQGTGQGDEAYAQDDRSYGEDDVAEDDDAANPDGDAQDDGAVLPSPSAPVVVAPGASGPYEAGPTSPYDDSVAQAPPAGVDPTAGVTDGEISAALDGHGQWIETDEYGAVWRPDATQVGVDFTPYETGGSWAYTDAGWAFASEYSWGWLPFHYGQWAWFHDYWGWVPGYQWSPAWVEWRHGGGVVGWRPLRPQVRDHRVRDHRHGDSRRFGGALVRDHRRSRQHDAHWRFAAVGDLQRPRIRSHLYGNLAEGLRVTSTVKAPPIRGRNPVRPADLMRNRFSAGAGGRAAIGRHGGVQVRDHRAPAARGYPPASSVRPGRSAPTYAPSQGYRPPRTQTFQPQDRGTMQPPVRSAPPVQTYQPPARGTYQPGSGNYRPPARGNYQPPVRTYQPPARGNYQPPARGNYQPPVRTYQPPARQPPARGNYQPPTRGNYQPPVRTYQPPARGNYQPPVRSAPTYTPPVRTHAPPVRTYTPSAPPARTWSPPARASSPPASAPAPSAPARGAAGGRGPRGR